MSYLHDGLPAPAADGLDGPYWQGLREETLRLQRCSDCHRFQWGPEWLCHRCLSFDLDYQSVEPAGEIYSFERVWHPVHPALREQGPYLIVLVRLPHADDVRVVGNLLGDPHQPVAIGMRVRGVFEHHTAVQTPTHPQKDFTLLQWRTEVAA